MRKRPKSRVKTAAKSGTNWSQTCIIVLLAFLVVLTGTELYLDHFASTQDESSYDEPIVEEKPDKTEVSVPVEKPEQNLIEQKASTPPPQPLSAAEINVQVLNGCGVRGIAGRVRNILRGRGFDVLSYGNARKQNYNRSLLIIRSEGVFGERAAEVLAKSLGISPEQIRKESDPSLVDIDVTVILGLDYRHLNLGSE